MSRTQRDRFMIGFLAIYITAMAIVYFTHEPYPWPFDPPSIHRVKPQQFGG